MTGDLTGTIGNFNKLTTVNNTGLANPVNGISGGSGDRIILWSGSATQPPYWYEWKYIMVIISK